MEMQEKVIVKCEECGAINRRGELFCYNCGSLIENEEVRDTILSVYLYNLVANIDKMGELLDARKDYALDDNLKADYYIEFKDHVELVFIIKSYNELKKIMQLAPIEFNKKKVKNVLILAFKGKDALLMTSVKDNVDIYKLAVINNEYKLMPLANNNQKY